MFALILVWALPLGGCAGADTDPPPEATAEPIPPPALPPLPPSEPSILFTPPAEAELPPSFVPPTEAELPPSFVDYEADCALPLVESTGSDGRNAVFYLNGERRGRGDVTDQIEPESMTGLTVFECEDLVPEPSLLGIVVVSTSD